MNRCAEQKALSETYICACQFSTMAFVIFMRFPLSDFSTCHLLKTKALPSAPRNNRPRSHGAIVRSTK